MTREEAIENLQRLQNLLSNDPYINTQTIITTCNVAIEALKQEPTIEAYKQVCKERDIAIEQLHELGYEWGQKIEPCGDAISRQAALKLFATHDGHYLYEAIRDLPSATPQEPMYCDRNICFRNEYNGIGCTECEVTKSRKPHESEEQE